MTGGSSGLLTGTLDYLRRPLVRNIPVGAKVLILSDTLNESWDALDTPFSSALIAMTSLTDLSILLLMFA